MKKLAAYYFSGTGNTKYVTERLCTRLEHEYSINIYDITSPQGGVMEEADMILLAFPIYGSSPPIPMREFLYRNRDKVRGKDMAVIVTQYMFSGDGAASLGRTAAKMGANVKYAEHFIMPNNICDINIFKVRNGDEIAPMLAKAEKRIDRFAEKILAGKKIRRGFGPVSHAVGYVSQRALFRRHEQEKRSRVKIDGGLCRKCGACVAACPVGNLTKSDGGITPLGKCALCYRCVNLCPAKAITIVGKKPPQMQYRGPYAVKISKNT